VLKGEGTLNPSTTGVTPVPEVPGIPGLAFRRFRGAIDFPGMAAVMNASLAADLDGERHTVEELANAYAHPVNCDPQQDTLYAEADGMLTGYAGTEWRQEDDGACLHHINVYLPPEWRGRGLELAMQRIMECRARAVAAEGPDGACHAFASMVPETWHARTAMLLAEGYVPARRYYLMQRSLDGDLPVVPLPPGLEFRPALPEHFRAIWEADEECFSDQRDHVAPSEENYQGWVTTPGLDPSLWVVAWDGDQVAGGVISVAYNSEGGERDTWGETDDLFVRRPWRRRGLGRALVAATLHLFKARGLVIAGLGVDAENVTGAPRLYEGLGYRVYQRLELYRKPM